MATKTLRNLQITSAAAITAQYDLELAGKTSIKSKTTGFPDDVVKTGANMLAAAQAIYDGVGTVTLVTCYTPLSDPAGNPPWSAPGECVDIKALDSDGNDIGDRWGDNETVPPELASARDDFKAAVQASL